MTQPIDVAFIDIVVRDKSLKDLRRDIDETFKKIDKDLDDHLKSIDGDFEETFAKIDDHFTRTAEHAKTSFTKIEDSVKSSFTDIDRDVNRRGRTLRRGLQAVGASIGSIFESIRNTLGRGLRSAFDGISDGAKNLIGTIGQLGSAFSSLMSAMSTITTALIVALIPAMIGLAAALSNLLGLVALAPAGLAVLLSAIIPLVVAFQNFGEAVSALASGDVDKINEALKKLSPSARAVAREIAGLLPVLKSFQKGVQEAFFSQVRGGFTQLASILPLIAQNFNGIAGALGRFVRGFIGFLTSINSVNAFNDAFGATARIIDKFSGPLLRFFDAMSVSVSAALPFVERIATAFGKALDKFSAFVKSSIETGAFDKFIEDAFTTVKELIDLAKALGGLLGTIFSGTEESGHGLIQTLTDIINRLNEFHKSAEGKDLLKALSAAIKATGVVLGFLVDTVIFAVRNIKIFLKGLEDLGRGFVGVVNAVGDFFSQAPGKFNEFVEFLKTIPGLIGDFISQAIDNVLFSIGLLIGVVLLTVQELPTAIINFLISLPQRIADLLALIIPLAEDIFHRIVNNVTDIVVNGFNAVVDFIKSVPDRIVALGPVFLNAGKNLIQSFMNGFRSVGSFIGDIAGDIVHSVKGFLNHAIDKINSGIAAIDTVLPGDLARIPHLAAGGVVRRRPGGILANIGEGGEDEVVSPLSTLEDIIRRAFGGDGAAGGMTINFGAGAINISFAGVVPTEGEAFTVGRAVGDGIASQLASRNVRTQLRAA